ncbi:MAG: lysine-sensitive aspartokinase 3 [Gemmatimonadaceae bacterium]|jgi:aspartate kinase|nr:lysine-sensitive aspartokinase 3 [Gemmatimonadaceae bacterium]
MLVVKFGGTSVGDAEAIERVATIVRARLARRPIVVVSAMAGVTNQLLSLAHAAANGGLLAALDAIGDLKQRHTVTAERLLGAPAPQGIISELDALLRELASLAEALATLGFVTPRSLDAIAAIGERLSAPLVTALLLARGIPASLVDARRVIRTDSHFTQAAPDLPAIRQAVFDEVVPVVARDEVPVLGGFIGSNERGVTTTLGRGGSDFSAALIGAALRADAIEIWTDVDGMLTADPRVIPEARRIEQVTFDEAAELASFGAKVLHPSTIAPAVRDGVPVFVFNSRRPADGGGGTRIALDAPRRGVSAIAAKRGVPLVSVRTAEMLLAHGFLRRVFEVFERHRTSVDLVSTSEVSISVTPDDVARLDDVIADLRPLGEVQVQWDCGVIAVVGTGLADGGQYMARAFAALGDTPVHMASLSASGLNLSLVVDGQRVVDTMRRLHAAFFGDGAAA